MATIDFNSFLSAVATGDITTLRDCINGGIDIHVYNDLALRIAKKNGQTEAAIFLLENGANINVLDDDDKLRYSSLRGDIRTVRELLKKNTCSQEAKIYATYNAILCGYDEIVELLRKDGISPNANDGAILKVLKLCRYEKVIALFKDYLK